MVPIRTTQMIPICAVKYSYIQSAAFDHFNVHSQLISHMHEILALGLKSPVIIMRALG